VTEQAFDYSNAPVRPSGAGMRLLAKASRGVRGVLADVEPYARAWQARNARVLSEPGPRWVVLGDSMAQGIGASSYDRGWPGPLAAHLGPAYGLVNLSFHGARVRDVLDVQLPAALQLGDVALITVMVGANDVVWRRHRAGLVQAFGELLAALPDGAVVANLTNPHRAAREVDRMLREQERLVLADLRRSGPRSWRGKLAPDHFHPNDRGYADIAEAFARYLPQPPS
jgi:lysophospholipase L1-like esterase